MTPEQKWDALASRCRIEILFNGTYWKESWCWTAHGPDGDLRSGVTDCASEAATMAKYAVCDYVDAVAGEIR